jgi:hypothetical protein
MKRSRGDAPGYDQYGLWPTISITNARLQNGRVEAESLFVGRPFQAVVTDKKARFRRPEKGVLHFLTASSGWETSLCLLTIHQS